MVPVTVNTPFNLMSSWQGSSLERIEYFPDSIATQFLATEKFYFDNKTPPNHPNVVVFILESFARDYCGWLRDQDLYNPIPRFIK